MQDFSSPLAKPFDFPEGDHGILLIHGFTGSPSHMRLIGEGLRKRGFAVKGILLPGHGDSPAAMKKATWQDWLYSAREAAGKMQALYPRFSVAGLSMGGDLALLLAGMMEPAACVSIAAPMKTTNPLRKIALPASLLVPTIHKKADGSRDQLDPEYDIGYDEYPTASAHHLNVIISRARQNLSFVRCPVLCIQSRKDETVTADSPGIILRGVGSAVKAQMWLKDAPHVCTISPEYPLIVDAMADFLRKWEG